MNRRSRTLAGGVFLAMGVAVPQAQAQGGIYACVDGQGRRLTADRPIPECSDREQRELNRSGTVRRSVGPALSEQEQAAIEARRRQEAEERSRQLEDRRRERALVLRYPNVAAHDAERAEALRQVDDVIAAADQRVAELRAQRKALDTEMEFYRKDPSKAPLSLQRRFADNDADVLAQSRFIERQQQERGRIQARFDAELARLRQLWAAQAQAGPPAALRPASSSAGR
ncbi:DUF4124 domain-containing protein [Xylophilus sp.]|uniref:DUF4124 domain-containing protein n=1 Tax=Xylophilus sp. TaxID=2653893 RepID=UPI0013BDEF5D|nr:DUF4124 domain-containing protein [Xylophilus sp.]KAF1045365.1 MAG: hypothetical protein GAK38_03077 [Xylophilus sp.]